MFIIPTKKIFVKFFFIMGSPAFHLRLLFLNSFRSLAERLRAQVVEEAAASRLAASSTALRARKQAYGRRAWA